MHRAEAISLLKETSYDEETISQEIEFVANKLRISVEEFMKFMDLPKKPTSIIKTKDSFIR